MKKTLLPLFLCAYSTAFAGDIQRHQDPETGLITWKIQEPGFSLQYIQLMPDYVTAIYSARGLPPSLVKTMASYCVFGTIIKNESDAQLSYRVAGSTLPAGAAGIAEDGAGGLPRGETVMSIFEPPRVFFVIWIVAMRLSRL